MSTGSEDFYAILGIDVRADAAEVRDAWRKLARRWHPDHAGFETTTMFQKLSEAYAVLSDPVARAAYDRRRPVSPVTLGKSGADAPRCQAPAVMIARVCGPLNALLACGIARRVDRNLIELSLNALEAAQGGMVAISMWVQVRRGEALVDELFSAWLAVAPKIVEGAILSPSVLLPGMVNPVRFRIRIGPKNPEPNTAPGPIGQGQSAGC